jgi:hypothetical protein
MTEATVLSTFLKKLRGHLPDAVVMKHNDQSLIGMPDVSVTYRGLTLWIEAKLLDLPKGTLHSDDELLAIQKRLAAAPVQLATCTKLGKAGHCLYLIFWRHSGLSFYCPITESIVGNCGKVDEACQWLMVYMEMCGYRVFTETGPMYELKREPQ